MIKSNRWIKVLSIAAMAVVASLLIYQSGYASARIPTVKTMEARVEDTSVTVQGLIEDPGQQEIRECGILWGSEPRLEKSHAILVPFDADRFKTLVEGLKEGNTYYYQAYAVNPAGTGYGEIKKITVPVNEPPAVAITSPGDSATVAQGQVVSIAAAASDDKKVKSMEVQIGQQVRKQVNGDELNYRWDTSGCNPGKYDIKVTASDGSKTAQKLIAMVVKAQVPKVAAVQTPSENVKAASSQPASPPAAAPAVSGNQVSRSSSTGKYIGASSKYPKLSKWNGSFGRFPYRDTYGGRIEIDPRWVAENIVTITLPGLNRKVQVHKDAADNFIQAFTYIKNGTAAINGKQVPLLSLVHTMDGTFVPRHVMWNPNRGLSNHSWGTAIDINASSHFRYVNPAKEPNDPNLILWEKAFKPAGFSWGNRYKDSMHYELIK